MLMNQQLGNCLTNTVTNYLPYINIDNISKTVRIEQILARRNFMQSNLPFPNEQVLCQVHENPTNNNLPANINPNSIKKVEPSKTLKSSKISICWRFKFWGSINVVLSKVCNIKWPNCFREKTCLQPWFTWRNKSNKCFKGNKLRDC